MGISVVIPVYNSEGSLKPLVERLHPVLEGCHQEYELILVNDSSRDNSWGIIGEICGEHPWVCGISLMRNYGQHNALLCGIRHARFDTVVTIDDDLQHPPEEIPTLLAALTVDVDVVYGTPQNEQHGFLRDLASQITKFALGSAMGTEVARNVCAFRAFRTHLRDAFVTYQSPFISIDILLTWATTKFKAIKVRHEPRHIGVSNYTFRKLVIHAVNMITGFSTMPLEFASLLGFGFTIFGVLVLVYVLIRFTLQGTPIPGFPFLASIVAIFSGTQLFTLGIMGQYLARMHFRLMDKPSYVVKVTLRNDIENQAQN
ncbi:MAG: hypothetical protein AMXMBFR84_29400 [Candidatus Hydrogenedentota bacterium]